jgi:hypothetical protein
MRGLGVFAGIIGFLCMIMGVLTFLGVDFPVALPDKLVDWKFWFGVSTILVLINIACVAGGRGGGGGGEV